MFGYLTYVLIRPEKF
ncbi:MULTISPECIES: potassium-transporting ATPase subunit F [Bacteroides]